MTERILRLRCGDGEDDVYECEIKDETNCPIGLVNELRGELGHFPEEEIDLREFGVTPVGWLCELVRQLQIAEVPTRIEDPKTHTEHNHNASCEMAETMLSSRLAKRYDQFKHRDDFGQTIVTFYHLLRYVMMPKFIIDMGQTILGNHIDQVIESFPCLNIPPKDPSWGCLPSEFNCEMRKAAEIYRNAPELHINTLDPNLLSQKLLDMFDDLNGRGWKGDWEDFGKLKTPNHDELEGFNMLCVEERLLWCKRVPGQPEWTLSIENTSKEREMCDEVLAHPFEDMLDVCGRNDCVEFEFGVVGNPETLMEDDNIREGSVLLIDLEKKDWDLYLKGGLIERFEQPHCWCLVNHDDIWVQLDFKRKSYFLMDLTVFRALAKSFECPLLLSFFWAVFRPSAYRENLMLLRPHRSTPWTNDEHIVQIKEGLKGVVMTPPLQLSIEEWISVMKKAQESMDWNVNCLSVFRSHPLLAYISCHRHADISIRDAIDPAKFNDPIQKRYQKQIFKLVEKFYLTIPRTRMELYKTFNKDFFMSCFWLNPGIATSIVVLTYGSSKIVFPRLLDSVMNILNQGFINDMTYTLSSSRCILTNYGGFRAANVMFLIDYVKISDLSEIFTSHRVLESFKATPKLDTTEDILNMLSLFQIGKERAMTILRVFDFDSNYFFFLLDKKLPKSATYRLLTKPKHLKQVAKNTRSFHHLQKVHELCDKAACLSLILTYPMLRQQLARAAQFGYWEGAITFLRPHMLKSELQFSDVLSCWKIPYSPSHSHSNPRKPISHSNPRKRKS